MEPTENKKQITNSVEGFLESAFNCIEESKYFQAREIFQQLLLNIPDQPNCLFGLGVISFRNHDRHNAEKLFLKILEKYPASIGPLEYLALIYFENDDFLKAENYAEKLVSVAPDNATYHRNLGLTYQKQKKYDSALTQYQKAISINKNYAECFANSAHIYKAQKAWDQAQKNYEQALAIVPNYVECWIGLGDIKQTQGNFEQAKIYYQKALGAEKQDGSPVDYATALLTLGQSHEAQNKLTMAQICYESANTLDPENPEILLRLGDIQAKQHLEESAKESYEHALKIKPDYALCLKSLGDSYYRQHDYKKAKKYYEDALTEDDTYTQCLINLGSVYHHHGLFDEEEKCYKKALRLMEESNQIDTTAYDTGRFNLGILQLLRGDFESGLENYTFRKKVVQENFIPPQSIPFWDGQTSLRDKEILVIYEQGYGDYIQFIRLCENLKVQGAMVHAICSPALKDVIQNVPFVDLATDYTDNEKRKNCYQVKLIDLAKYFNISTTNIPNTVPYIFADNDKIERFRQKMETKKSRRIGICYQGSKLHPLDKERSIDLSLLEPLFKNKIAAFYNVSLDADEKNSNDLVDLSSSIEDFSDTAAIIANLDLLITVDTAAAHLAGAMNKPCWILLPFVPDWRWQLDREDSPWYPSVRLFRQEKAGDWESVIKRVNKALQKWIG